MGFLMAQMAKNLPAMQETWVCSLGQEDPLEKGMATHSSTLAWRVPWTQQLGRLQPVGSQRVRHDRVADTLELRESYEGWSLFSINKKQETERLLCQEPHKALLSFTNNTKGEL